MAGVFDLLSKAHAAGASDLTLFSGHPPTITAQSLETPLSEKPLSCDDIVPMLLALMSPDQSDRFERSGSIRFSCDVNDLGRIRVFAIAIDGCPGMTIRFLPSEVLSLDQLGLGHAFSSLIETSSGLILVTGPSGSGKTTTLASMVDHINTHKSARILTIEDPIEFIHGWKQSVVRQHELNGASLPKALRRAVTEDADVIVVGDLSDHDAVTLSLIAAETGHLVLGSLDTPTAKDTVESIIQLYPFEEKAMIRSMLSDSLQAVVSQRLITQSDGQQFLAQEIMLSTPEIKGMIQRDELDNLYQAIEAGSDKGMKTLDQSIEELLASQSKIA